MLRLSMYGFPPTTLAPDEERVIRLLVSRPFRPEKLIMAARIDEIRGYFKVKRSRLPLLDRDNVVCAFTKIRRHRRGKKIRFTPGRTTLEFRKPGGGALDYVRRTYLPSSVAYHDVDPLCYIELRQMFCDHQNALAPGVSITAEWFGASRLDNALPLSTARSEISILLKNTGNIPVHVHATFAGRE